MKRTPLKSSKGFAAMRKPMTQVSAKKRAYRASSEGREAKAYMAAVATLPCCICGACGPSEVHHVIHGRYGTARASDFDTIPLCVNCHRIGPNAIHNGKDSWRERNGPDYSYIEETRKKIKRRTFTSSA